MLILRPLTYSRPMITKHNDSSVVSEPSVIEELKHTHDVIISQVHLVHTIVTQFVKQYLHTDHLPILDP